MDRKANPDRGVRLALESALSNLRGVQKILAVSGIDDVMSPAWLEEDLLDALAALDAAEKKETAA